MRKTVLLTLATLVATTPAHAQLATQPENITPARLDAILNGPNPVAGREPYKVPLRAAYIRQAGDPDKQCQSAQGQQPYNICMGQASTAADADYATIYNSLQLLCHDQAQLATLQASERSWEAYKSSAMKATFAAWPNGTAAPGFAGQVDLLLIRDRLRELQTIYTLNISQ